MHPWNDQTAYKSWASPKPRPLPENFADLTIQGLQQDSLSQGPKFEIVSGLELILPPPNARDPGAKANQTGLDQVIKCNQSLNDLHVIYMSGF